MKYEALDEAILQSIRAGKVNFYRINAAVEKEAAAIDARPHHRFRAVDRRLQALRKRGLIKFDEREWRLSAGGEH